MSCQYYQKLLHLNRPGELSPRLRKKLDRHTASCSSCAAEKFKIEKASDYIAAARETKPELADPGLMTAGIMRAIRGSNDFPHKSRLDILSLPKTRLALIGLTAILIGAFFLQEFFVLYRISKLEERMTRQSSKQTILAEAPAIRGSRVGPIRAFEKKEFLKSFGEKDMEAEDGEVSIKKSMLRAWLTTYRRLQQENRILLRYLQAQFPELRGITLEDGLNPEEIEALMKNKKKIFNTIDRL